MTEDTATTSDTPANTPPVRVPNVSAGAVSGLAHEVIGSNAQAAYEENQRLAGEQPEGFTTDGDPDRSVGVEVPAGDLDSRVQWVSEGADETERGSRANAVWDHETTTDPDANHDELSARLTAAVYPDGVPAEDNGELAGVTIPDVPEDLTTVDDLLEWVHKADSDNEQAARARAVLNAELARPEDDQRKTLVEPLEALLAENQPEAE